MAGPDTRGSVFKSRTGGYGIRWPEGGKRPQQTGFATKRDARRWFDDNVASRLRVGAPDPSMTFDRFADLYVERHGATVSVRTKDTLADRLRPARERFGDWTLRDLEGAAADVAAWRAGLKDASRYRLTGRSARHSAQPCVGGYMRTNPAVEAGRNPQPRAEEFVPFSRSEIDMLDAELGDVYGSLVVFAAETGLRTNEWAALERRDVDQNGTSRRRPASRVARGRHPLPEDRSLAATDSADRTRTRGVQEAPREARHDARLPGGSRRLLEPRQLAHPRVVRRARRRRDRRSVARITCAIPSRPRRSPLASRSSSWPA